MNNPLKYTDPSGNMNYFTQTDDLLKGVRHGVASWIWDIIRAPLIFIKIIKELVCGELTIGEVIRQGFEYFVNDIKYVTKHLSVFKPTKKTSNKDVYNMGYHAGRVIAMVVTAISKGIGIANKFKNSKIGQKIISKSKKIGNSNKKAKSTSKTTKAKEPSKDSGPKCFVAGTQIITRYGSKNIEDIQIGDYVLAENPETGEIDYKEVVRTFVRYIDTTIHVIANGTEIETTSEHPFWVEGKGFIKAGYLQKGDILRLSSNTGATVENIWIEAHEEEVVVYNFEVADFHTYFVSELGVLVHNNCGAGNSETGNWNKGSFDSAKNSLDYHYGKHGKEVGATSSAQYLRKAEEFAKTAKKGSTKSNVKGAVEGTIRYRKNGKYIDIAPDGSIVSFGK